MEMRTIIGKCQKVEKEQQPGNESIPLLLFQRELLVSTRTSLLLNKFHAICGMWKSLNGIGKFEMCALSDKGKKRPENKRVSMVTYVLLATDCTFRKKS